MIANTFRVHACTSSLNEILKLSHIRFIRSFFFASSFNGEEFKRDVDKRRCERVTQELFRIREKRC